MLQMSRRDYRLARVTAFLLAGLAAATFTGCKEEFSDEQFGVLDLAIFYDGGNTGFTAREVPSDIPIRRGYVAGELAEFYDFGVVPAVLAANGAPVSVRVQPMYFFFNGLGQPLFSHPVRETRTGVDWMKGGENLLDPNPKDFCKAAGADPVACAAANAKELDKSYPLRLRDPIIDRNRGVDDFQRPIVDLVPGNNSPPNGQYTGLWEIVAVTVPDDYKPDAIKHVATLNRAINSGKYSSVRTGKVINCPIVDERTAIPRGVTARKLYYPRIELWYRRLLATCFLANGWETLGTADGQLYFSFQVNERVDTFEIARVNAGNNQTLSVNVGRAYRPTVFVFDDITGARSAAKTIADNEIVEEPPKRAAFDPSPYTPVRWIHQVPVSNDYIPGSLKSVKDIDVAGAVRSPVQVRNLSVRGVYRKCSYPLIAGKGCGKLAPDGFTLDPTGDPTCRSEGNPNDPNDPPLECNPDTCSCDAPFVGYGERCGEGIAQCRPKPNANEMAFAPNGFKCFPPWGGFCQRACDPAQPNSRASENMDKEITQHVDSRCGEVPGLVCFAGLRTCFKFCDQNIDDMTLAVQGKPPQCSAVVPVGAMPREIQEGQTCQYFGLSICAWPESHSPKPFPLP